MVQIGFFRAISQNNLGFLSELYTKHKSPEFDKLIVDIDVLLKSKYGTKSYSLEEFLTTTEKAKIYIKMSKDQVYNMAATLIVSMYSVYLYETYTKKKLEHLYGVCFGVVPASLVSFCETPQDILDSIPLVSCT